jgi:hypothetical protein
MKFALFPALLIVSSGCATIMTGGGSQTIHINSEPPGARVFIDGHDSGTSPIAASVDRRQPHFVRIELAGYSPYEMKMGPGLNGWIFGNILFGGVIGIIVDCVDGAVVIEYPDTVDAVLLRPSVAPSPRIEYQHPYEP